MLITYSSRSDSVITRVKSEAPCPTPNQTQHSSYILMSTLTSVLLVSEPIAASALELSNKSRSSISRVPAAAKGRSLDMSDTASNVTTNLGLAPPLYNKIR